MHLKYVPAVWFTAVTLWLASFLVRALVHEPNVALTLPLVASAGIVSAAYLALIYSEIKRRRPRAF